MTCVQYIYENCGQEVSWEDSGLEDCHIVDEKCATYVASVAEAWKAGLNTGINIKGY